MEDQELKKSYYAVIPANVRYDKELTPNAKLLYAEITALCNEKGYCWATNKYFADLYQVSKISISNWIRELENRKYISTEIIYAEGTKQILHRYIKLFDEPIKKNFNTPIKGNFKDNNKYSNTKKNNNNKSDFKDVISHNYTKEQLMDLYDNLDNVEI